MLAKDMCSKNPEVGTLFAQFITKVFLIQRIFLENKKMVDHFLDSPPTGLLVGFFVSGVNLSSTRVLPESGESPLFSYEGVFQTFSR